MLFWSGGGVVKNNPSKLAGSQETSASGKLLPIAALVCAISGCVMWVVTWLLLDPCDQGEQLARYFAALVNVMFVTGGGSVATILLITSLVITRRKASQTPSTQVQATKLLAFGGLCFGTIVLIAYLPRYLMILN